MSTTALPTYPYAIPHEILFAFDPTDDSQKVMECAKSLAKRFGSHITVAHVSQPVSPFVAPEAMYFEDLDNQAAARTDAQLDQAVEDLRASGLKADKSEHWGMVSDELQKLAREKSADLLVLGTHAPRGLDRLFFGSTAEDVADRSGWPVMIVGPKATFIVSNSSAVANSLSRNMLWRCAAINATSSIVERRMMTISPT